MVRTSMKLAGASMLALSICSSAAVIPVDLKGVRTGPVKVQATPDALLITWPDETGRECGAEFSLDTSKPLITALRVAGKKIVEGARPLYWASTGKRRGGWDQFFDFPPSHPDGTRRFQSNLQMRTAKVTQHGDRVEVHFDGLTIGHFTGGVSYTFFPASRLIQQEAVVATSEPDTAYYYDAGIQFASESDRRAGNNMDSLVSFFDTEGRLQTVQATGPERQPHSVRYRTAAARTTQGSVAVFPAPHQYFFARDFTSNMGYLWSRAWRGQVGIGIRQLPDDNSNFYPWMNAPPGSVQRMSLFLQISDAAPQQVLEEVLRYTSRDRYPGVPGYKTLASHWHVAYTVQAMEKGFDWTPPFKPVLEAMGIDAAMIMDFHGDGHPADKGEVRLKELAAFYRACRAQSGARFLLIPGEEANVHYGGHWAVSFPKPVHWIMSRQESEPFTSRHPELGTVYRTRDAAELLKMVRAENGMVYQTHPRTKGSMGYPDKVKDTEFFRDPSFFGAGWKQMPSDLSTLRQGLRALDLLDDMSQWGLRKLLLPETDLFQLDHTHELYAHMNVSYVRIAQLPKFDDYGQVLTALRKGGYFTSTGEVLLPRADIARKGSKLLQVDAQAQWTMPLAYAVVVWGDGANVTKRVIPLHNTRAFGDTAFTWEVETERARWARVELWDVAGSGAMSNPVWFE